MPTSPKNQQEYERLISVDTKQLSDIDTQSAKSPPLIYAALNDSNDGSIPIGDLADAGNCSAWAVAFNIVNTTVGAGIIGLPYALAQAGFGAGILLTLLVAFLTNASLILMIYCGMRVDVFTFAGLARYAFGGAGFWIVNGVVLVNGIGTTVSYLIIIGDTLAPLIGVYITDGVISNRYLVIGVLSVLCIFPLLFWRTIGKLAKISIVGVMCVPIILFTVAYRSFIDPAYGDGYPVDYTFVKPGILPAVGVMAFAFVSNQTAYMNFKSLRKRNVKQWSKATSIGVTASLLTSLTLAIMGYVAFGDKVQANLLNTFPADDHWINFTRLVLGFSMFVSYPMQFYPARLALAQMLKWETDEKQSSHLQHIALTIVLFIVTLAIGLAVADLGKVYALVGAICSTLIAYILPGAAVFLILYNDSDGIWLTRSTRRRLSSIFPFHKSSSSNSLEDETSSLNTKDHRKTVTEDDDDERATLLSTDVTARSTRVNHCKRLVTCAIIVLFGVVALISGTTTTLYSIVHPSDE